MSASQSETFSTRNIIVLGGLLLIALFIGEIMIGPHRDEAPMVEAPDTAEDIAMRIEPVVSLEDVRSSMTLASGTGASADKSPAELYQGACLACHTTGAAGAPKIGDAGAWSARLDKGLDALVDSAINGIGAMPPRGGSQYSDEQIRAAIEYILDESR